MGHLSLVLRISIYNVECGRVPSRPFGYNVPIDSSTNLPFPECNFQEVGLKKGNVKGAPAKVRNKFPPENRLIQPAACIQLE